MATDILVGFPGETEEQYERTVDLIAELRPDKVHCAAYSSRPGTVAGRTMEDEVSKDEKARRRVRLEELQEGILTEINSSLVGQKVDILVEGRRDGKWHGRTRSDKLVFFRSEDEHLGELVNLNITRSSPWSLQGELTQK